MPDFFPLIESINLFLDISICESICSIPINCLLVFKAVEGVVPDPIKKSKIILQYY